MQLQEGAQPGRHRRMQELRGKDLLQSMIVCLDLSGVCFCWSRGLLVGKDAPKQKLSPRTKERIKLQEDRLKSNVIDEDRNRPATEADEVALALNRK